MDLPDTAVAAQATQAFSRLIGRDAEIARVIDLLRPGTPGRGVVLLGMPGMGKTELWSNCLEIARQRGMRVLSARPSAPETGFAFAGLTDLFEAVTGEQLADLPVPLRRGLEVALLRIDPTDNPPTERQIAAAVLGIVRALAGQGPLVVGVDDVNWLDQASAQAVAFAARRITNEPVRFLLARRPGRASTLERAFIGDELERLELRPLSVGATRSMLARRLPIVLPRRVVARIHESSGGNPLYALEVGRRFLETESPPSSDDLPIPDSVEELVGDRIRRLPREMRRLLAAVSLGADLRAAELATLADPETVKAAIEADVIVEAGNRLRPAHPLLAAAVRSRLTAYERRDLHRELANRAHNEEVKARHLALSVAGYDARLASQLNASASRAKARGAVGDAVDLAELALRLTPPGSAALSDHLLTLAECLVAAGEHARASDLLRGALDGLPAGRSRARAHLLLNESDFHGDRVEVALRHLDAALVESVDEPDLHALVIARRSRYLSAALVESIEEAERIAALELPAATKVGPSAEREVLFALAFARKLRGRPIDDLVERSLAASPDAFFLGRGVQRIAADRLASRGLVNSSRDEVVALLDSAEERGEGWSAISFRLELAEVELRSGNWGGASQRLDECEASPDRALLDTQGYARCRALVEAGRGHIAQAERLAAGVLEAGRAENLRWNMLEALRARGQAALLAHEPERAATALGEVWAHTERVGIEELGEFPVAPDLVEALVELRDFPEASSVIARVSDLATAQEHPWGLATAKRSEALVAIASAHDVAGGVQITRVAAAELGSLGLRFDQARTLRAAGRELRRLRKWGLARELLVASAAGFDAIGSDGWAADVGSELERLGGRRVASANALTAAERQISVLAADGHSNKEIAAALHIGISTVETHLRHSFAKLQVQSRAQLGARLRE